MTLAKFLRETKKSQLQAFHLHWLPSEEMSSSREALERKLREAMTDPGVVRLRFERLKRPQKDFLLALLAREVYSGSNRDIRASSTGQRIEDFELDIVVDTLREQGFIHTRTSHRWVDAGTEIYAIPQELGDALRATVDIEERSPQELLGIRSRAGAEEGDMPDRAIRQHIEGLVDPELRDLARRALEDHGGVLTLSHAHLPGDRPRLNRPAWRRALEAAAIGTTGVLSLKEFGIEVEEESLIVYPRNVVAYHRDRAAQAPEAIDREVSLGVDLLIDLARLLEILRTEPPELTRDGALYKKTEDRLAPQFVLYPHADRFEGRPVRQLVALASRLHLLERDARRLRPHTVRTRMWEKKPIVDRLRAILELFLSEGDGDRASFHQRPLREILLEELRGAGEGWLRARSLLAAAVARFLGELEARQIAREFRVRLRGEFAHGSLVVPLARLQHDLSYWVVNRLAPLGVVDLGYREARLAALRLSPLGAAVLGVPWPEAPEGKALLVNPDFEVLLFPGGPRTWDLAYALSRFADRTGWEQVKRYRLHRESVKRGVLSGLKPEKIVEFLRVESRAPLPKNVVYSIREWAEGVEFVRRQRALVLRGQSAEGIGRLAAVLRSRGIAFEAVTDTILLVRGTRNEKALSMVREELREQGLFLD